MGWTEHDIPDLTGKVAVVTGASTGLGFETARALADAGAEVVIAARHPARSYRAAATITAHHPGAVVSVVPTDLASLASVHQAAKTMLSTHRRVDILVNSAGIMAVRRMRTRDGFDLQLGVNHLGHFALTTRLLPALLAAPGARVVSITSVAYHLGRALEVEDPPTRTYPPWTGYGRAKLANLHFGIGLHRLFRAAGVEAASLVADPGLSLADIRPPGAERSLTRRLVETLARWLGHPPARAALPQLRAATDPAARSGELYGFGFLGTGEPARRRVPHRPGMDEAIDRLWLVSQYATGLTLDVDVIRRAAGRAPAGRRR